MLCLLIIRPWIFLISYLKTRTYDYEINGKKRNLYIKSTDTSDVYFIYENSNDTEKIGIAYIPNLKISHYLKENVSDGLNHMKCIYNNKFNKWIPLEKID